MSPTKFTPKGSTCVVTGGANGIGKEICRHLAKLGAKKVIVVDLSQNAAQNVVDKDLPPGIGFAIEADCGLEMDMRRVIVQIEDEFDAPIDAFFCNAGILSKGSLDVSNDEWEKIWQVNVMQTVYVARHLFPRFEKRGKGALVVTASSAGLLSMPGALPYSVTKHAAVGLAEWLNYSYYSKGIQVCCVCPQLVKTAMVGDYEGPLAIDGILSPEDVAKETVEAMIEGRFMVFPHKIVKKYISLKSHDYEKWLRGMRKVHDIVGDDRTKIPDMSSKL